MKKVEIEQELRIAANKGNIKLPKEIDFSLCHNKLSVCLQTAFIIKNMQNNNAAFEGWILVLKRWLNRIEKVELNWKPFALDNQLNSCTEIQHYQRFLYRVDRFLKSFSWVEINKKNRHSLDNSKVRSHKDLILNISKERIIAQHSESKELDKLSESELEKHIIQNDKISNKFKQTHNLDFVNYQLPVGLFYNEVAKNNSIFPGNKSAIDIWGINNKNEFCLFELKTRKNKKVGSISEMLFYSWIINDIQRGLFKFDALPNNRIKRIKDTKKIICYLLTPETHPLIDHQLTKLISSNVFEMKFMTSIINKDFEFMVEA